MRYDYIFVGFGLSTMVLLDELIDSGLVRAKSILILEQAEIAPEKTWSFWEKGIGKYDDLLSKSWTKGNFINNSGQLDCLGGTFIYKSVSSSNFSKSIRAKIDAFPMISIVSERLLSFVETNDSVSVSTDQNMYETDFLFNSVPQKIPTDPKNPLLLQHFEGWFVKTENAIFNADEMTIMDFSIADENDTRFMYVLPFSSSEALVEFTLFSPTLLDQNEYEVQLKNYLERKGILSYKITKIESGVIPMTTFPLWKTNSKKVLHIGTAGGWTKASTGYTFFHAMKRAKKVISELKTENPDFENFHKPNRFTFYDRIFIYVLFHENYLGKRIFSQLFTRTNPVKVLEFLNENSSLADELKIIWSCPKIPFIKAFFKTI